VHGALLGLGYSVREADDAVQAVAGDADAMVVAGDAPDVGVLLRQALRSLGGARV
jgi:holliday junction DNA helicase RuvA